MQKLKICFVTEDFYPSFIGGQGIYGHNLVKQLAQSGHHITVLAENRKDRQKFWQGFKNIKLTLVPFCFGNQLLLALFEYLSFILLYKNIYFDIVHANQLSGLFFVLFKPNNVKRVVVSQWNTHFEMQKHTNSLVKRLIYKPLIFLEKILYSRAEGIIFDSSQEEQNFKKFLELKSKPIASIYLGTKMPKFSPQERLKAKQQVQKELNLPTNARIILFVGRLVERKRVDTLLKALKLLKNKGSSVYGVIVGNGSARSKLEKQAPSNTRFVGFDSNPRKFYLAADLFVTVSVAEGGFLLSALDAASFGLPLILSPSAAGFPIIKEGINGYLADPNNPYALSEKIKLILSNNIKMGLESRKLAKNFNWHKCSKDTTKFYCAVLGKNS